MEVKRGDLVTVAVAGDYGKPRPALVIQSDAFDVHPSVTILPLTSEIHDAPLFRITVPANKQTGLKSTSQVMVDKTTTVPRAKIARSIGRIDTGTLEAVSQSLQAFLGA